MGSIQEMPRTSTPPPLELSSLPPGNSPDLQLVPATELERTQSWHINCHEWRGPLSPAQYFEREAYLERQSLVSDGKITFWILTLKTSDPNSHDSSRSTSGRPILAACETVLKSAYVAQGGKLRKILAHGIGSVYCRSEYRGKGYASRMISELGTRLGELAWQQPKDTPRGFFSVLYSDIGRQFYAKHAWKPMPSTHIVLLPVHQKSYEKTRQRLGLPEVKDLTATSLETVCQTAISQVETELIEKSRQTPSVPFVAFRPDVEHMGWHHAREDFQARTLFGTDPEIKGAIDPSSGCALIWSRVWRETPARHSIDILRTVIPSKNTLSAEEIEMSLAALLLRAQLESTAWDMLAGVEVWAPEESLLAAATLLNGSEKEVEIVVREKEHICSLRWEGEGDVQWFASEKYPWM